MKTITERAKEAGIISQYKSDYRYDKRSVEYGYIQGATEQKAIYDAELLKIKSSWEMEAQINLDSVEKDCKACENELRRLKTLLNERGVPSNLISVGRSLSNIRKEMEEICQR